MLFRFSFKITISFWDLSSLLKVDYKKKGKTILKNLPSFVKNQVHTFTQSQPIMIHFKTSCLDSCNSFSSLEKQVETIQVFYQIELTKQHIYIS